MDMSEASNRPGTAVGPDLVSPEAMSPLTFANSTKEADHSVLEKPADVYRALVVDSGPIIRLTGLSSLRDRAKLYYTVPDVLQEIRDAKARQHLDQLPFELITREASPEGIQAAIDFARQTGDYRNLSSVDLQVLGLLYDLEREGCDGDMTHVRKTPKRTLGVGKVRSLSKTDGDGPRASEAEVEQPQQRSDEDFFQSNARSIVVSDSPSEKPQSSQTNGPKTWAMLVNPDAASTSMANTRVGSPESKIADQALHVRFGSINISGSENVEETGGQFSDAEEDYSDDDDDYSDDSSTDSDDSERYANGSKEISDEECDVYILDPEEVEERRAAAMGQSLDEELQSAFPSLAASMHVPYEDGDMEGNSELDPPLGSAGLTKEEAERRKEEALRPLAHSGKLYNSFRRYGDIMKPKVEGKVHEKAISSESLVETKTAVSEERSDAPAKGQSRIIGGMIMSGQGEEVEDDGEGWIVSSSDIRKMKAAGRLQPTQNPNFNDSDPSGKANLVGPCIEKRAACATTDFAMQNVILQMNLELMSVDGIKVRRLKSWVTRCGACYTVDVNGDNVGPFNTRRLFCARCGSDMLQRVAASVDGKTGRLRLHLSKKYKNNLRGTKYSLPKPGTHNRFQGDLLLREDQLLMGAWNQKVKQRSGGKARSAAQSMFGSDLASTVGCNANVVKGDDIKVGFGRRNPNASKFGRERRGKKKKTPDKACGLRRY